MCYSHSTSCKLASGVGKSRLHLPIIPDLEFWSLFRYGPQELHVCTSCFWCPCTLVHSLPGFSGLHWQNKTKQTIETQFGTVKKSIHWAMVGWILSHSLAKFPLRFRRTFIWVASPVFRLVSVLCLSDKDFRWIYSNKRKTDQSLQR